MRLFYEAPGNNSQEVCINLFRCRKRPCKYIISVLVNKINLKDNG